MEKLNEWNDTEMIEMKLNGRKSLLLCHFPEGSLKRGIVYGSLVIGGGIGSFFGI